MLSQPEVIEVEEPVFPLLLYPNPGEPYRQRLGQYLKRIDAGTSNVSSSPLCMGARAGGLSRLSLEADGNPKVVSEALGHSCITITLDLYSHVLPNMQHELAGAVANILKW